jgi:oxygen-dependent protoporphyrinogen oxidase
MPEIVVIGAGLTGLTCTYQLQKAGKDVVLLEEASTAGGKIGTERVGGYLLEAGPNSLRLDNAETRELIDSLGLTPRLLEASPDAKKRFVLKHGRWLQLPAGAGDAFRTRLLMARSKLRILREPFVRASHEEDESVGSFVARRFGRELLEYAADPFISGIYAGDPSRLSVRHAFPALWDFEQTSGSVVRGAIGKSRQRKTEPRIKSRIVSFPNGLGEMTEALRRGCKDRIHLLDGATEIRREENGYVIRTSKGERRAKQLVFATPAYTAASLLSPLASGTTQVLERVEYAPVAVAYLGYRRDQFRTPIEGFGALIPSSEHRKILGVIFSSSNFPDRAPEGEILLTVLMGGARNTSVKSWPEQQIIRTAVEEVTDLFEPAGGPVFTHARLWPRAIPQYNVGYSEILSAISAIESELPNVHLIGNYRGGISMGACIRSATELAKRLV